MIIKEKSKLSPIDLDKYNSQYNNLTIIKTDSFHDRFIIIDKNIIYHCCASLNHAGKRTFAIDVIEDHDIKKTLLSKIRELEKLSELPNSII